MDIKMVMSGSVLLNCMDLVGYYFKPIVMVND